MTTTQANETHEPPAPHALDPRIAAGSGWGHRAALSVAAGSLIAVLNLYGLARILGAVVGSRASGGPNGGLWGVLAVFKVIGLFGGVWLLMGAKLVDPIPLVVGWCALPVGVALASLISDKTDPETATRGNQAPPAGPPGP